MKSGSKTKIDPIFIAAFLASSFSLYFFFIKYVPLIKPFLLIFTPILFLLFILSTINIRYGTLLFIFLFPLINNLPYFFGIHEPHPHAPAALVLFLFYFPGWLLHKSFAKNKFNYQETIFKPIVLLSIIIIISTLVTFFKFSNGYPFLSSSIYELYTNVHGVTAGGAIMSLVFNSLNYLSGFLFFFILYNLIKSKQFLKQILVVFCASTLMSLLFGLFQHLFDPKLGNNPVSINLNAINSTFKDALSFGAYIAIIAPLIIGISLSFKGKIRILSVPLIFLFSYLILLTGSRSGFICFLISILIFFALLLIKTLPHIINKTKSLPRILIPSFVIFILILAIVLSPTILQKNISELKTLSRIKSSFQSGITGFLGNPRIKLWKLATSMIIDYPLSGVGIGAYVIEASNYAADHKLILDVLESAENYFLQNGSELGLLGIFLALWIFWEILKRMKQGYRQNDNNNMFLLIGTIAGIISYLINIQAHTYIGSYEIKYSFWLLVGILFYLSKGKRQKPVTAIHGKYFKILSVCLIVVFSAVHLWNSTNSLSLDKRTSRYDINHRFGFYQNEKNNDWGEFRWTKAACGLRLNLKRPVLEIPVLASHPDITTNPVKVKIFMVKNFFREKILIDEIILSNNTWRKFNYTLPEEVNKNIILLLKISRTWNPSKTLGTADGRDLGIAVGRIQLSHLKIADHNSSDASQIPNKWITQVKSSIKLHYTASDYDSALKTTNHLIFSSENKKLSFEIQDGLLPVSPDLCIMNGILDKTSVAPEFYWKENGDGHIDKVLKTFPAINTSIWEWGDQLNHYSESEVKEYLNKISLLEQKFPEVNFIYTTGNAQSTGAEGYNRYLRNQQIRKFCRENNKILFDSADLEAWHNAQRASYTYNNKEIPKIHPTSKSKKDALWWLLARLSGWNAIEIKSDLIGTWSDQDTYYKNTDTGEWIRMASPAERIAAGDNDGDGSDDLFGIWPEQNGVWVKYSNNKSWEKLATTADWITTGNIKGDRRDDFIGTWDKLGVFYRESFSGAWVKMALPARQIAAGDLDGDGSDDLIGIWPEQNGVWVKYSNNKSWEKLASTADWIYAGDMNGDGRDDFIGTWNNFGVFYRESASGAWIKMAPPARQITAGDLDGDGSDDLIGIWPEQDGVWVKYSNNKSWEKLASTADWITTGKMFDDAVIPDYFNQPPSGKRSQLFTKYQDVSDLGPEGNNFTYINERNLRPPKESSQPTHPSPGEPAFFYQVEKNLVPKIEKRKNKPS